MKCPGSDTRFLRVEVRRCAKCGSDVEIFSDEVRVKCRKCGGFVYKEIPSCIDWCKYAGDCIGEEKRLQMKEEKRKIFKNRR